MKPKTVLGRILYRVIRLAIIGYIGACMWHDCFAVPWMRELVIIAVVLSWVADEVGAILSVWAAGIKD